MMSYSANNRHQSRQRRRKNPIPEVVSHLSVAVYPSHVVFFFCRSLRQSLVQKMMIKMMTKIKSMSIQMQELPLSAFPLELTTVPSMLLCRLLQLPLSVRDFFLLTARKFTRHTAARPINNARPLPTPLPTRAIPRSRSGTTPSPEDVEDELEDDDRMNVPVGKRRKTRSTLPLAPPLVGTGAA